MTAATTAGNPYMLPDPAPGDPVVLEHLVAPMHAHLAARYRDRV